MHLQHMQRLGLGCKTQLASELREELCCGKLKLWLTPKLDSMTRSSVSRFTIPQRVSPRGGGWSLLFLGLAAGSGIWVLGVRSGLSTWYGLPNTPLTLLFLTAGAIRREVPTRYQWSVVAGLGFSPIGDAFLMQRLDFFMAGLGSFLVAHLCYVLAFTSDVRRMECKVPIGAWPLVGIVR